MDKRSAILAWLDEQEALLVGATATPWAPQQHGSPEVADVMGDVNGRRCCVVQMDRRRDGNQEFAMRARADARAIAASRTVLPLALAALRAEVEAHEYYDGWCLACHERVDLVECPLMWRIFASLGLQEGGTEEKS